MKTGDLSPGLASQIANSDSTRKVTPMPKVEPDWDAKASVGRGPFDCPEWIESCRKLAIARNRVIDEIIINAAFPLDDD